MTLQELRIQFTGDTGRLDLINADDTDNGADYHIKAGLRHLDTHYLTPKSIKRYQKDLSAGSYLLELKHLLSVKEVWIANSDGRSMLKKRSIGWMRENYNYPYSDIDQGTPANWASNIIELSPEQKALETGDYTNDFTYEYEDLLLADETGSDHFSDFRGIMILPPPDETYTALVWGVFGSYPLSNETDENFWTVQYPEILVMAAMMSLERTYRNREGVNALKGEIDDALRGIDFTMIEEDIAGNNQMEELV